MGFFDISMIFFLLRDRQIILQLFSLQTPEKSGNSELFFSIFLSYPWSEHFDDFFKIHARGTMYLLENTTSALAEDG